ncbi:TRAP transporter small permease subunit [Chachezhania sediminis]|uniref:TRAP transporter small permease subunit n=1 Tax=Chachezhania sediminis TaxID=2599291 RepID=UPI00131AE13E|nr:TRAP transporter small permease [Chachezhania sediminis]
MKYFHAISRFSVAVGSLSGLATGAMMLVILTDVIGRAFFASPLPLATEISVMLLIAKVFLGMAGAQATDSNFQVTILIDNLSPRALHWQRLLSLAVALAGIGIIAWFTAKYAISATEQGEASFGVYHWPIWPERIILSVGLCLLVLQIAVDLVGSAIWGDEKMKAGLPHHSGAI